MKDVKKYILLVILGVFMSGCSGVIDEFLDVSREEETEEEGGVVTKPGRVDVRLSVGSMAGSTGGGYGIRATTQVTNRELSSGVGNPAMKVSISSQEIQ